MSARNGQHKAKLFSDGEKKTDCINLATIIQYVKKENVLLIQHVLRFNIVIGSLLVVENTRADRNSKLTTSCDWDRPLPFVLFLYAVVIRCFVVRICWHVELWVRTKSREAGHIYFLRRTIRSLRRLSSTSYFLRDHCINYRSWQPTLSVVPRSEFDLAVLRPVQRNERENLEYFIQCRDRPS